MNLTFGAAEIWGDKAQLDPKGVFFQGIFSNEGLVDISQPPFMPTLYNNRNGVDVVAKRLDCFLFFETLIEGLGRYRTWIDKVPVSNHFPFMLQLDPSREKSVLPL